MATNKLGMKIHIIDGKQVISKTEYKKYMRSLEPDLEDGETYDDWFETYWTALKEDGLVIVKGRCQYVIDDK